MIYGVTSMTVTCMAHYVDAYSVTAGRSWSSFTDRVGVQRDIIKEIEEERGQGDEAERVNIGVSGDDSRLLCGLAARQKAALLLEIACSSKQQLARALARILILSRFVRVTPPIRIF